jgi:hypothetical protein
VKSALDEMRRTELAGSSLLHNVVKATRFPLS